MGAALARTNSRCCCNETPSTAGQKLDILLPAPNRGNQQSYFPKKYVMQYARETLRNPVRTAYTLAIMRAFHTAYACYKCERS